MDVVASWTGRRADALRQALRMTNESFADYLGVAARTVAYWRERPDVTEACPPGDPRHRVGALVG